jgi:hypothetical protein
MGHSRHITAPMRSEIEDIDSNSYIFRILQPSLVIGNEQNCRGPIGLGTVTNLTCSHCNVLVNISFSLNWFVLAPNRSIKQALKVRRNSEKRGIMCKTAWHKCEENQEL